MKDQNKTKKQLIIELMELRHRIVELGRSEECYRSRVERVRDIIYTVSLDGTLIYFNTAFENITGWSCTELIGKPLASFVHPDDWPLAVEMFERMMRGVTPPIHEVRVRKKSGEYFIGEFTITPGIEHGKVVGVLGVGRDITERKRVEEALREREQEIRVIAENVPALFSYIDTDNRYRFVNKRYEEWFGIHRTEIIGKHFKEVIGEAAYDLIKGHTEAALSGHRVHYEKALPYTFGGPRWVSVDYVPDADDRGKVKGFFALVTDITERKRVEEALRRNSEEQDLLLNNIQTQVWYLTDRETYGAVNKARADFFGMKNEEMENKKFYDVLSKDEANICMSGYAEVFEKRKQVRTEEWITNAKGEKRLLSIIKSPKLNENGEVEYVVCSAED
ncbi:MAG: PAS domain S-box protein, partial [Pseudobdellovibrionaceae bacterium]